MSALKMSVFLSFLILLFSTGCKVPATLVLDYGPRWVDYEEWGNLEIGVDKKDVLNLLGEPYMTTDGSTINGKKYVTYIFKLRTKLFITKQSSDKSQYWDQTNKPTKDKSTIQPVDMKPKKFDSTQVWGQIYDVYFMFENNKLVKWYCPELNSTNSMGKDSLKTESTP